MSNKIVLDSSAILALVNREDGSETVMDVQEQAIVSAVNLAEVFSKLSEADMPAPEARLAIDKLEFSIIPFDLQQAQIVGALRPLTKSKGLGLGDRACIALAQSLDAPVLTADHHWAALQLPVEVRLFR